jgi:hypothetical protein
MRSAKSMLLVRKEMRRYFNYYGLFVLFGFIADRASAQDNSPYSRYGLGNLAPSTNISNRGMGSISSGMSDPLSINFNNPASYSGFQTFIEQRSKKVSQARVVLDVGINFDNRSLVVPNTSLRYGSSDALFSYVQVGIPIRKNWGLSFGLRPVSRINYSILRNERLTDPISGDPIDSAQTQFTGSGGVYLPTIGTGFAIGNLSLGVNLGYMFGKRETTTDRTIIDTILYHSADYNTITSFGHVYVDAGLQYKIDLNKHTILRLGLSGNLKQTLNATQDVLRQTFTRGSAGEVVQIDSVYQQTGVEGKITYPASFKGGFVLQNIKDNGSGWLVGVDYSQTKWNDYRFYGLKDSVKDNWLLNVGGQFFPKPGTNFFSRVVYRFGFYTGPDYINLNNTTLPQFGVSAGLGLPIASHSRLTNQFTVLNIALEYAKRGNNSNLIKENMFRLSVGFNFTDFWFGKRKYD